MDNILIPENSQIIRPNLIVDGSNLAYRAYHGNSREDLRSPTGMPSGGVYGFANTLLNLITRYHPQSLIVAWDSPKNRRKDLYEGYKSGRAPMPDDLKIQWHAFHDLVGLFGGHNWLLEGYEADDLMASWSKQVEHPQIIFTGDKDLMALVCDGVTILRPGYSAGSRDYDHVDEAYVKRKFGVKPSQIDSYLALVGDSADGWSGVKGIGEVAARKILETCDDIHHLYENLDKVENPRHKKLLEEGRDMAMLGHSLTQLQYDAPLPHNWNEVNYVAKDLHTWCLEWGMRTIASRLDELGYVWP